MKLVHTGDPRVVEMRSERTAFVVLIGVIFAACGVFCVGLALDAIPVELVIEPEIRPIALALGGLGCALGVILVGGRRGKNIDGRRQVVCSWSGLWVPLWRKVQPLEGYTSVGLVKEVRGGERSSGVYYPVSLNGQGLSAFRIARCTDYLEARRLAEAVARGLHRSLTDSTSGDDVVREADRLDESLRERMRRLGSDDIEMPPRPSNMVSDTVVTSNEVVVDIPGMKPETRLVMNFVVIGFALGVMVLFFGVPAAMRGHVVGIMDVASLVLPILFVGIPLVMVLRRLNRFNRPVRITANRAALTVVEEPTTTEIPGNELEELAIVGKDFNRLFVMPKGGGAVADPGRHDVHEGTARHGGTGQPPAIPPALAGVVRTLSSLSPDRMSILARSDHASIHFGIGLDTEEIAYLHAAILRAMID